MKIGFIGIGNVGGALAMALGKKGHSIYLGARSPESQEVKTLVESIGANASAHILKEAVLKSDILFLATPWKVSEELIKSLAKELTGKILIDCTNPLKSDFSGLEIGLDHSGGEAIQNLIPNTKVYKAFNTTGFNIMENPILENKKAVMFFCGNDQDSRHLIHQIVTDVGFEAVDAGALSSARLLEPFALLWISSAYKFGLGRDFAFTLIKR